MTEARRRTSVATVGLVLATAGFATATHGGVSTTATTTVHRRTMTLRAFAPNRRIRGSFDIEELVAMGHVTVVGPGDLSMTTLIIRPGTCSRRGVGRAIRVHGSSEAAVSFDDLRSSTFAVESQGRVSLPSACADHRGQSDLTTTTRPGKPGGWSRQLSARIIITKPGEFWVRLDPLARGRRTLLHATTIGAGGGDAFFRLRRGSCSFVGTGLELPFDIPGGEDGEPISVVQVIALPFASFRRGWVAEGDWDPEYNPTVSCVSI